MFKMSVILNLSVSTEQRKCSDERKCKWQEIRLKNHANDRTNWSFLKFREIPWNC